MALHSGTRRPRNPAVGDMITSLGGQIGWLWWPVMSSHAPSRHPRVFPPQRDLVVTRFRPAAALAITTTVDCTGHRLNRPWARSLISHLQYNPGCVPAFHRVGGWGVRPATRFVRFNFAVFPAASQSLILFSGHPCRHALHLSRGERGGESARLPVLYPQAVCCHRCQCCAGPPAGVVFRTWKSVVFLLEPNTNLGFSLCQM